MPIPAKFNERGRRVGESHPRAVLTDHEVELLLGLLDEREALVAEMLKAGATALAIVRALKARGLTLRLLAVKFEISKGHVAKIQRGERRCQTPVWVGGGA